MKKEITLFFIFLLFACSANRDLSIDQHKKIPQSVAVIFSEELEKFKQGSSLGTAPFYGQGGYFEVGKSLSVSLFEGINSVYQTVAQIKESDLSAGNFDRIIKFSIDRHKCGLMSRIAKSDIDFEDIPGEGYQTRSTRFDLVVLIEAYDGDELELINSKIVKGEGIYRRELKVTIRSDDPVSPRIMGYDKRKNRLEKAIKEAIQDVNQNVINLLESGF
jgi:hypothetical protein